MTEYRMPVPPEGYEWVVSADWEDGWGWFIRVELTDGEKNYNNNYLVKDEQSKNPDFNARVVMALVDTILDLFYNGPPPPPPALSFNGLRGYRRG